jgi:DNA-binding MarR family transcriptional regulator
VRLTDNMNSSLNADGERAAPGRRATASRAGSRRQRAGAGAQAQHNRDSRAADLEAARGASPGRAKPGDLAVSVVGQLFRLAPRLVEIQDLGARDYGLGFARGRVLWALLDSGPVLMRALSDALRISPRTVTGLIDALEADGWVTRSPHPADRRATIISLTVTSERTLARLRESYENMARDLLGDLSADDLARCRQVIGTLEDRLDEAVSRHAARWKTTYEQASGGARPRPPAVPQRDNGGGTGET